MIEEMRNRGEEMGNFEQQRLWDAMNEEREREKVRMHDRMRILEVERSKLEQAIDREREEREILEALERK